MEMRMPKLAKQPQVRFEATVHSKSRGAAAKAVADLDLDRLPDLKGPVRVLVNADDVARLVAGGYEVRLLKAHPVQPLDPSLVLDDDTARTWLETQTRGLKRQENR
jgi:hypothetical protein